ncbi:hypothetical protein [Microbacterium sp.]|uniref:DUF7927 domain-containing protein n=1 Tax=Microbacterium sp. TaxID=51671 RepID=UPI002811DC73|nr:hypothetical protein [Microbacterium sp.]
MPAFPSGRAADITSNSWPQRAFALVVAVLLGLVALVVPFAAPAAHAESSPDNTFIRNNGTFHAYVEAGETVDVSFIQSHLTQFGGEATVTVSRPGATPDTCVIPATATEGFECGFDGLTAASDGIWAISYIAADAAVGGRVVSWDITVRDAGVEVPGRVWTNGYTMFQAGEETADFTFHYQAVTGDQYRATYFGFNGVDSIFRANAIGVRDAPNCAPIYESVQANLGPFATPYTIAGTDCGPQYKLFFDEPAADLPASATRFDGTTDWILPPVVEPDITNLTFTPTSGTEQAGVVTFDVVNFVGTLNIAIDANGNGSYDDPEDRTIPYAAVTPDGSYTFDGLDGLGNPIPASQPITVRADIDRAGEIHFTNSDVEVRTGGIEVVSTRGPDAGNSTLYWDDTVINTQQAARCSGPLDAASALEGVDSSGGVHGWDGCGTMLLSNRNDGLNGSYGDTRIVQEWTYRTVAEVETVAVAARAPEIVVTKSANPAPGSTVLAGETVEYTVTFQNTGDADGVVDYDDVIDGVLDDATVTAAPVASDAALTVSGIVDGRFSVDGTLAAAQVVTVTYSVMVNADGERGDNALSNFVVPGGELPPEECVEGSTLCTEHYVPEIVVDKSADPESGSTVVAGEVVTYTITFENIGAASGLVDWDDVITGILDDATITAAPTASNAALTVSGIADGRFSVDGTLAPDQVVTVSYSVMVNANGERGDNVLSNFVVPGGELPPEECLEDSVLCTEHPVSEIVVDKSADPESGSTVLPGDVVTYTITFENVGAVSADVDRDDVISGVLDDATITAAPVASDAALTVSGIVDGRFSVDGTLAAGQVVTVSYSVMVNADGERGDNALGNFVVPGGELPPEQCVDGSALCTVHNVPPAPAPPAPSDGGLAVTGGQVAGGLVLLGVLLATLGAGAFVTSRRRAEVHAAE